MKLDTVDYRKTINLRMCVVNSICYMTIITKNQLCMQQVNFNPQSQWSGQQTPPINLKRKAAEKKKKEKKEKKKTKDSK